MTTLVTGARGAVARTLLNLLRDKDIAVRAGSRQPERLDLPEEVPIVRCDLTDPATFTAALDGVTSVFLYTEPSTIDAFVRESVNAGVEHIVLLSTSSVIGRDAESDLLAKSHLDVERALACAPVETTFLRPGSFAGNALAWSWTIKSSGSVALPYPNSHTDPIHEADIAESAFAVLTDRRLRGQGYHLSGPESLTFADQVDQLALVTGQPITVNAVTREEWKTSMADYIPGEFADGLLDWWLSNDSSPVQTTSTVEELTGHPPRTFAVWVADHAAAFHGTR